MKPLPDKLPAARISAPANLLLFGEYAITEEGGLGIALAAGPRLAVTVYPGDDLQFFSNWDLQPDPENSPLFQPVLPESSRLIGSILRQCKDVPGIGKIRGHYYLDSSRFKTPDGQKSGLGSSAALAAALCAAVIYIQLNEDFSSISGLTRIFTLALKAHRSAQNGRGSGYDVAASVYGGTGLFTGGLNPEWTPVPLSWLEKISLVQGLVPVSSPKAVDQYLRWKASNPSDADHFFKKNNELIGLLLTPQDSQSIRIRMNELKNLSRELGFCIGVPAVLPGPGESPGDQKLKALRELLDSSEKPGLVKALGAGNELFGILNQSLSDPSGLIREVTVENTGVRIDL